MCCRSTAIRPLRAQGAPRSAARVARSLLDPRCLLSALSPAHAAQFADAHVGYANELLASFGQGDHVPEMNERFAPALWKVSATLKEIQELSRESFVSTERSVGRLQQSGEDESRRLKEARRRFAECDLEWSAAVKRAHSVRREAAKSVSTVDRDFVDAKLAFESARTPHASAQSRARCRRSRARTRRRFSRMPTP